MATELWIKRPCEHGETKEHLISGGHPESSIAYCANFTEERLDPERVVEVPAVYDSTWTTTVQDVLDALEDGQ